MAPLANPIAIDNYFIAFAPWGARTAIFFLTRFFSQRFSHKPTMRPFVLELGELQNKILEMGGLVETSIHNSIRSLVPFEPMDYDAAVLAALGERAKARRQ